MRFPLLLPLAATLIACAPADPHEQAAEQARQAAAGRSIQGEYLVTYVNEAAPLINIEGHDPTVKISADRVHFQSQCIYADWSYSRDGEDFEASPWDYGDAGIAMCARALAPGEEAISAAIENADTVRFVRSGIWFSGEGGTVQLERIPDPAEVAARAVDLRGEWRVAGLDGEEISEPIALSIDFENILWEPGCAGQSLDYRIEGDRFYADYIVPQGPVTVCSIGYPDELIEIWHALDAAETIERTPENGVRIHGNGRSVTLFSQ